VLLEKPIFARSYGGDSLFFVSSIAIVTVASGIRILRGSMMDKRVSYSIPRGSISRTTNVVVTASRQLITIRMPPIR
jgi:hypothetical protein